MKTYHAEVFIDDRQVYAGTIQANQPWIACTKAIKEAKGRVKHRPVKYVVRLTKLVAPKATEESAP